MQTFKTATAIMLMAILSLPQYVEARAGSDYGGSSRPSPVYRSPSYQGGSYNYRPRTTSPSPYSAPSSPYSTQNYPSSTTSPYSSQKSSSGSFLPALFSGALGSYIFNKVFNTNTANTQATTTQTSSQRPATTNQVPEKSTGGFFRIILLLLVVFFIWRFLKKRRLKNYNQTAVRQDNTSYGTKTLNDVINQIGTPAQANVNLSENDQREFGNILVNIQNAWSNGDLRQLKNMTTPEMFETFSQTLQENQRRGITNTVTQVKLLRQELQEAWQEGNTVLARVALTWSAIDFAIDRTVPENSPGYLIDGNKDQPTIATEVWTFKRDNNGPWILAEITQ
jgi:hypothetical protein